MTNDAVHVMVQRLRDRIAIGDSVEPMFVIAAEVFQEGLDDLSTEEMTALETTGFAAVRLEGEPDEIRVPSVVRMIRAGRPYDHVEIDPEDRPKVMFLGFLAVAAESPTGTTTGTQ